MHRKLALKNATRSMKDYGVYFFTLVLGVCVFYMFNSIYSQQAMLGLSERMTSSAEAMQKILGYVSVFVAIVLGFLIVYANLFFIKRRKKEMGIYCFENASELIESDMLEHIFEPFVRLEESRTEAEGAGIGLAIVKELIELHKGNVHAEYEDGRIRMMAYLPICKPEVQNILQ